VESVNFDRAAGYYDKTRALPAATMRSSPACSPLNWPAVSRAWRSGSAPAASRCRCARRGSSWPVPLAQADATRLPFAAGTFGSVLAVHVLHLIPDWRVAVDEAIRVLRPGGALVASFPTDNRAVGAVAEYLAGRATARAQPGARAHRLDAR
jgi:SAM-dependent methyltransferase